MMTDRTSFSTAPETPLPESAELYYEPHPKATQTLLLVINNLQQKQQSVFNKQIEALLEFERSAVEPKPPNSAQTLLFMISNLQQKQLAVLNKQVEAMLELDKKPLGPLEKKQARALLHQKTAEEFQTISQLLANYQGLFHEVIKKASNP
jgi:hypothetical protein